MTECIFCRGQTHRLIDPHIRAADQPVQYFVCEGCGFTMKAHGAFLAPKDEKVQYDYHENSPDNVGYVAMFEDFIDKAVIPFTKPCKVLDFGCGPGPVLLERLQLRAYAAVGYDPFYANDLSVLKNRYPLIVSTEVFEHFHHPVQSLSQLDQLLEPFGHLAVMTRFRPAEDQQFLNWWYRRDKTHVAFFTESAFQMIATRYRWQLVFSDGIHIAVFQKKG